MKNILRLILFVQIINLTYAQSSNHIDKHQIDSDFLNETREIWMSLPTNYDPTKGYPVMYVLDAEWQFDISYAIMKELAINDKIPDHIVIGIPHVDVTHRFNDLTFTSTTHNSAGKPDSTAALYFNDENTGGGSLFYKYLTDEVMPFVDSTFLTNGFDVLIGHSLSGYFGAYILNMEGPFNAFQLYDPSIWYNEGNVISHFKEHSSKTHSANVFIATADGGRDRQQYNVDSQEEFHKLLVQHNINSELRKYDNENHGSVRLPSLIDGLSHLYDGFSFGYIFPTDTVTVADVQKHYRNFSQKVNYNFDCPVDAYRWVGYANYTQGKWEEAIEAYELCSVLYETDVKMVVELAECYRETKAFQLSLSMYKKALVIDQSNESLQLKIKDLEQLIAKNKGN